MPPEQVIGTALAVKYDYGKDGKPILIEEPELHIEQQLCRQGGGYLPDESQRPYASFGNSTGDQQMLNRLLVPVTGRV